MKKHILYLLVLLYYFLFVNMSCGCGDDYNSPGAVELTSVELLNYDFSGTEFKVVDSEVNPKAYVIGLRCFVNTYELPSSLDWEQRVLLESAVLSKTNSNFFINTNSTFDLITDTDFDSEHPAGSSVNDCFVESASLSHDFAAGQLTSTFVMRKYPTTNNQVYTFRIVYRVKAEYSATHNPNETIEAISKPVKFVQP